MLRHRCWITEQVMTLSAQNLHQFLLHDSSSNKKVLEGLYLRLSNLRGEHGFVHLEALLNDFVESLQVIDFLSWLERVAFILPWSAYYLPAVFSMAFARLLTQNGAPALLEERYSLRVVNERHRLPALPAVLLDLFFIVLRFHHY